jgi:hypothetical protein
MQFLVIGESIDPGPLLPVEQVVPMLEQRVVPSLEMLDKWEAEGRVRGGVFVGERKLGGVLETTSPEEASPLLSSLPFWGLTKWDVRALQSWRSAIEQAERVIEQLKARR